MHGEQWGEVIGEASEVAEAEEGFSDVRPFRLTRCPHPGGRLHRRARCLFHSRMALEVDLLPKFILFTPWCCAKLMARCQG